MLRTLVGGVIGVAVPVCDVRAKLCAVVPAVDRTEMSMVQAGVFQEPERRRGEI